MRGNADVLKNAPLDWTRPLNLLFSENVSKSYYGEKAKTISKTQKLIFIYTVDNIRFRDSWTKFP